MYLHISHCYPMICFIMSYKYLGISDIFIEELELFALWLQRLLYVYCHIAF